jgi:hypothetical protein
MNASDFTRGMKAIGFGTRMWVGVLVIALLTYWLGNPDNRRRLADALFAE